MSTITDLKSEEGVIIKGKAIYKDKSGEMIELSSRCPHLGCSVMWNNKEKTWDCPCHGSRFTPQGKVIQGPAIKDLSK